MLASLFLGGAILVTLRAPVLNSAVCCAQVVQALLQIAGPDAGLPPPEVLGTALRAAGRGESVYEPEV